MTPPDENALLLQAISLAHAGRKEDAHALLHKIVGENPHDEMAWLWLVQTESDPAQQIPTLEECLRNNPKSEYAKKGLAGLRAQMGARSTPPLQKPPAGSDSKPRKPKGTPRRVSGIWKIIFMLMALALAATLIAGVILFLPVIQKNFPVISLPSIQLPIFRSPAKTATSTGIFTPLQPSATFTATASLTPTVTRTRTSTFTPSKTGTPTFSPTPTLYLGTPTEGEPSLIFMEAGGCGAMAVPISGGGPHSLTPHPPETCLDAKISPDGARIAFTAGENTERIEVIQIDGTGLKPIITLSPGADFHRTVLAWEWSPNGKRIALVAPGLAESYPGFLYTVASDGSSAVKQIKNKGIDSGDIHRISWSPDSQWIFAWDMGSPDLIPYPTAFRESDSRSIVISDLKAIPELGPPYHFDWSPDSRFLSFIATEKPNTDALPTDVPSIQPYIVVTGLDKTIQYIPLPMIDGGYDPFFGARWSPAGSSFVVLNSHTHRLEIIGTDGTVQNRLIAFADTPPVVQWSPDGEWISIVEMGNADDTGGTLEIIRRDGTDLRILATGVALQPVVWK